MATISRNRESLTITIPGDYLEDMRTSVIAALHSSADALRSDQKYVLDGSPGAVDDRASALGWVRGEIALLGDLLGGEGETTVSGSRERLSDTLQEMARLLAARLVTAIGYAPVDMGAALDLAARLRWTAEEALRIEPSLDPSTWGGKGETVAS